MFSSAFYKSPIIKVNLEVLLLLTGSDSQTLAFKQSRKAQSCQSLTTESSNSQNHSARFEFKINMSYTDSVYSLAYPIIN